MTPTRRDFLKATLGASTLLAFGSTVPALRGRSTLWGGTGAQPRDTSLVVLQLSGGNDGLNTLVPFDDDYYGRSRPTLRLPATRVHKLNAEQGFHPQMEAFLGLYEEGYLSILQGVGYANSNRDHAAAMRDWYTARPGDVACETGWLGRTIDEVCSPLEASVPGVFVGSIPLPFALNAAESVVPSFPSLDAWRVNATPGPGDAEAHRQGLREAAEMPRAGAKSPLLSFLRESAAAAHARAQRIAEVVGTSSSADAGGYPDFQLAQTLKVVAQLIRAEVGIRVYFTELGGGGFGGFDSHANQAGNHGALLRQLSESVAAFVRDLRRDGLLDRMLLMTFSEFGRTVAENGRRGTDHGAAAPLFLAGGNVKGGLHGARPSLSDLEGGAPKAHTDFRRVYATALDSWLGFDSQAILGERFEPLAVLEGSR